MFENPIIFDEETSEEVSVLVHYKGEDYLLTAASGTSASKYKNKQISGVTLKDGKPQKMQGVADADLLLLSCCLYETIAGGEVSDENPKGLQAGRLVGITIIGSWPNRVVEPLVTRLKRISDLDEADVNALIKQRDELSKRIEKLQEGNPKNVQEETTDGSD